MGGVSSTDFITTLEEGSLVQEFLTDEYVSRYDMAKYINEATCHDCVGPDETMITTYTAARLENKKQDLKYNIEDISVEDTLYNGKDYFYCVAEITDTGYMSGYPRDTIPFCPGKFC